MLTTANDHNVTTELFYWKTEPDSDETFLVLEDTLIIDLEDGPVQLNYGRLPIVPAQRRSSHRAFRRALRQSHGRKGGHEHCEMFSDNR